MAVAKVVAGVMSGTSLDGVDVAIVRITGMAPDVDIDLQGFVTVPYSLPLRSLLMEAATQEIFSVAMLSQLNVRLAHEYAHCIQAAMEQSGVDRLDFVGSHGQTVRHLPDASECAGMPIASTLQIGDPSVLANLLEVPVVGDFRMADMALGGQGAPLIPYYDFVALGDVTRTRGLLNVGGIANLTVLPEGGNRGSVYGFDTGCGNMVLDALAEQLLGASMDRDGQTAASGQPSEAVLDSLLQDEYFHRLPPKSTGRERYGPAYVSAFLDACAGLSNADVLATATALTARSVYYAYRTFVASLHPLDVLIVSGGGRHNRALMQMLSECFAPIPVTSSDAFGVDSDAKEAVCFAVLAHAAMQGYPAGMPGVTGASASAFLGKICMP